MHFGLTETIPATRWQAENRIWKWTEQPALGEKNPPEHEKYLVVELNIKV